MLYAYSTCSINNPKGWFQNCPLNQLNRTKMYLLISIPLIKQISFKVKIFQHYNIETNRQTKEKKSTSLTRNGK